MSRSVSSMHPIALLVILLLLAPALNVAAQDANPPAQEPSVDSRAKELLNQCRERLAKAQTLRADLLQTYSMQGPGMNQTLESRYDMAIAKPNKLVIKMTQGMMDSTVVSDGQHLYTYIGPYNRYVKEEAPADLRDFFSGAAGSSLSMGASPLAMVGPLLFGENLEGEEAMVGGARYVGEEDLRGKPAHRLAVSLKHGLMENIPGEMDDAANAPELVMEVWIDAGEQPLMQQVRIDMSQMMRAMADQMGEQGAMMREISSQVTVVFENWRLDEELPEEHFTFAPPAGAKEVASFMEAVLELQGDQGEQRPHSTLGKSAPEFDLELLDGGRLTLDQHKGEQIVILDFWATWCGPCVKALPEVMAAAEAYRDKGVVLYAVNMGEGNDKVQNFLRQRQWKLSVALDRKGDVARQFGVLGIPHTVIIDKDGIIQAVHVGYMPGIRQRLQSELDALLEGKSLTEDLKQGAGES